MMVFNIQSVLHKKRGNWIIEDYFLYFSINTYFVTSHSDEGLQHVFVEK